MFIVRSGELITTATAADGREVVFYRMDCHYGPAPLTALIGEMCYENDCFAHTDSELIVVETSEIRKALQTQPGAMSYILDLALRRLSRRTRQWEDASLLTVGARIGKWLLEHATKCGSVHASDAFELRETERLIGLSLGGISRESVSRHLAGLARAGVISKQDKTICIIDHHRLHGLASGTEPFPEMRSRARANGRHLASADLRGQRTSREKAHVPGN
jgi:CRP-like cAMP-binding protein